MSKLAKSPLLPVVTVICLTGLFWSSYKIFYRPYAHQKQLQEAEAYAEFIYRREQRAREASNE